VEARGSNSCISGLTILLLLIVCAWVGIPRLRRFYQRSANPKPDVELTGHHNASFTVCATNSICSRVSSGYIGSEITSSATCSVTGSDTSP
jgi:hypothetical protein